MIDADRPWRSLMDLAGIGAYDDEHTGLRADAGLAAAQVVVKRRELVDSSEYGALRATVGHLAVHPDLTHIVPARGADRGSAQPGRRPTGPRGGGVDGLSAWTGRGDLQRPARKRRVWTCRR